MREEIQNPFAGNHCFFCGSDNSEGLHLKFYWDQEKQEASAEYMPDRRFAGQGDIVHGAIQMGLLDEIMGWTSYAATQEMAVTSALNVRFLRPTYIRGEKVTLRCRVTSREGRKVNMHATLTNNQGEECTTATGTFHILPAAKYQDLIYGK